MPRKTAAQKKGANFGTQRALAREKRAFALSVSSGPIVYALLFDQIALWVAGVDADTAVSVAKTSDISTDTLAVGDNFDAEEDVYNDDDDQSKNQQDRVDEYFGEENPLADDFIQLKEPVLDNNNWAEKRWRKPGTNTNLRGAGSSRTAYFERLKKRRVLFQQTKDTRPLTSYYKFINGYDTDEEVVCEFIQPHGNGSNHNSSNDNISSSNNNRRLTPDKYTRAEAINFLYSGQAKQSRNAKNDKQATHVTFQATAILKYLHLLEAGETKLDASTTVASVLYGKSKRTSYKATSVRTWAAVYLKTGEIIPFKQGKHVKTKTIISDEAVQAFLREELRKIPDLERTPKKFHDLLVKGEPDKVPPIPPLLAGIYNAPDRICESTARIWMLTLGFKASVMSKGFYTDGHNRIDVIDARKVFLDKMQTLEARMRVYHGDTMEEFTDPVLKPGEQRLVLITHDESTFYCNEGKRWVWMENGKKKIIPKGKGSSIMVSGFVCECHGFMKDESGQSYQFFEAGKNREGWFTNADLVLQLQKCDSLFKNLHPDCDIVIAFDNSMTHHAKEPGGLDSDALNLSDGGASVPLFVRNGWYMKGEVKVVHEMHTINGDGVIVQKGRKTILTERNKFKNSAGKDLKNICKCCKSNTRASFNLKCEKDGLYFDEKCCAKYVLSQETDFLEQLEWLESEVVKLGFKIIFYPKYHCELNFIEKIWGFLKCYHRRICNYSYQDLINEDRGLANTMLHILPISTVRKFSRHCFRFMDAYRQPGLEGPLADYAMKRYSSHRKIPDGILMQLTADFKAGKAAKLLRLVVP